MKPNLKRLFLVPLFAAVATCAIAQGYPSKPITLVLGFPPGGGADGVARPVAEAMSKLLGQPVVLDYRPGAGTTLASAYVAAAKPDGYTLYLTSGSHYGADRVLYGPKVKYDGASFTPVARWTRTPLILAVNTQTKLDTVPTLVAAAKSKADALSYASSGNGVPPHLAAVLFENATGTKMLHVPFKGGAAAVTAVAAGDVNLTFATPPSVAALAQTGKVKMIAVTSAERSPMFPDLPSIAEAGVSNIDYTYWSGLFGPAGLPQDVVNKLADASNKALADPALAALLRNGGNQVSTMKSPAEFAAWAKADGTRMQELMRKSGAKVE
jgi:tripartite-type tricarboxylate transporter receptor subunit TctC